MKHELDVDTEQMMDDLRTAMGIPEVVWTHDSKTWTIRDLMDKFGLGDHATRMRAEEAVEGGRFVEGVVRSDRGHYITAYRLAEG